MKQYKTVVLNGYSTKKKVDELLNDLAKEGYQIHSTVMGNIIIMERENPDVITAEFCTELHELIGA